MFHPLQDFLDSQNPQSWFGLHEFQKLDLFKVFHSIIALLRAPLAFQHFSATFCSHLGTSLELMHIVARLSALALQRSPTSKCTRSRTRK
eukprot:s680_g8.t1